MSALAMVMPEPGGLVRKSRPVPEPGPGEAIVRVRASSMNYHDLVNLSGLIPGPFPRVPMSDGVGEVVAVADDVIGVSVADRVVGAFFPEWLDGPPTPADKRVVPGDTVDGWLQQFMRFPAVSLADAPPHLSDLEAATLPCAGTTAFSALQEGSIGEGDVVVTLGTGGVSLMALQLAKARGAIVIITSSSGAKLETASELGADHCINARVTPDWPREVRRITDGRGADLVVDLGGADTLEGSVKATRMGGTVAVVGGLGGFGQAGFPVSTVMTRHLRVVGISTGSVAATAELCRSVCLAGIRPWISHTVGWDEIPEAMRLMQAQEHVGKIAIGIA